MTSAASSIESIHDADFSATVTAEGRRLTAELTGTADLNVKPALDRFLASIHEEAQRLGVEQVTVDLKRLEFMNSSCLKGFVWWITTLQKETRRQYQIVFHSSPSLYWQRRSLNSLACLASDLVSVQT